MEKCPETGQNEMWNSMFQYRTINGVCSLMGLGDRLQVLKRKSNKLLIPEAFPYKWDVGDGMGMCCHLREKNPALLEFYG